MHKRPTREADPHESPEEAHMYRNTILVGAVALWSMAATGCYMYMDDDDDGYSYCDDTGCYWCDDWGCYPEGGGPGGEGWACESNEDCAAGCYCDADGICQEAGFCQNDNECPEGFVCDERDSCVPEETPTTCDDNTDCPNGSVCNTETGQCEETGECGDGGECPEGQTCDDRNTCVPNPPVTCDTYTDEDSCVADEACDSVYRGINCTDPDGESCTSEEANCECERFVFHECVDATQS
jgi:hypothetical protein